MASAAGTRSPAAVQHLALADQREPAVGQRREVAARSERAVLGHHRVEPGREQGEHRLGHHRPRARAPHGERAGAQEHHRPHHLALDRRPHPGRVRADQRALKLLAALRRDPGAGERAEPGRHAVDRLVRARETLDHGGALLHGGARLVREPRRHSVARDGHDVGRLDPVAGQLDRGRPHHGHSITSQRNSGACVWIGAIRRAAVATRSRRPRRVPRAPELAPRDRSSRRRVRRGARLSELGVDLPRRQPAGEETGQHALLRRAQAVDHDRCRGPSHHLGVLVPLQASCKTEQRL